MNPTEQPKINTIPSFQVNPDDVPPMLQHYLAQKKQHVGEVLLYQMGDFYETFFEDALICARALEITLTSRDAGKLGKVPMAGVPIKSAQTYIERLLGKNFKIAICQQVEDPQNAKGLVERKVTRVLSKGTALDSQYLLPEAHNYIAAVYPDKLGQFGLAWADLSTGQFQVIELDSVSTVLNYLDSIEPAEVLTPGKKIKGEITYEFQPDIHPQVQANYPCTANQALQFQPDVAEAVLKRYFQLQTVESFGLAGLKNAQTAAAAIIQYLGLTFLSEDLPQLQPIRPVFQSETLKMNATTRANLELTKTSRQQERKGSLLWVLDKTQTPMGGRLLKELIVAPSTNPEVIEARLEMVGGFIDNYQALLLPFQQLLSELSDLERLSVKVINQTILPREWLTLHRGLLALPQLSNLLAPFMGLSALLEPLVNLSPVIYEQAQSIQRAISEAAPMSLKDGHVFKTGFSAELDRLYELSENQSQWLERFEQREREASGLKNLKVGFNNAFGYFIEISKAQAQNAPSHYTRKQSLTNAERFITPELKTFENEVYEAKGKVAALEAQLYAAFKAEQVPLGQVCLTLSKAVALLDVLQGFAQVSREQSYCRPEINQGSRIALTQCRHPIIEKQLPLGQFVANDCALDSSSGVELPSLQVITGPNMAGKSTYMRQVALCVLMAQIGCYVPAAEAQIAICDQLFSRIGAVDDIGQGQSTFMVEMVEAAEILSNATPNSLVILDEIGRGTSTFDGISIAWAIAEHIVTQTQAKTLFATHYHELNTLEQVHPKIQNVRVLVDESDSGDIRFMYQVAQGSAQKSYGVQVAKMAGLPKSVVQKAEKILAKMQEKDISVKEKRKQILQAAGADDQLQLFTS